MTTMTANVVEIIVKARTSVREGFDAARKEAELAGNDAGESYTDRFVSTVALRMRERIAAPINRISDEMGKNLGDGAARGMAQVIARGIAGVPEQTQGETDDAGQRIGNRLGERTGRSFVQRIRDHFRRLPVDGRADTERSGDEIGDTLGRRIRDRVRERVKEVTTRVHSGGIPGGKDTDGGDGTDKDKNRLQRWFASGVEAAQGFANGFSDRVSTFFSGDLISILVKALAVGTLATALAPVIGAGITGAILLALGGGVLAVGIAGAFKDPRILGAANDLKTKLGKLFEEFGKPFRGPVADFLEKFSGFIDRISPKMKDLGDSMAPLVGALGDGFIGMLDKAMPGILKAVEASKPLFDTLAKHMPQIGDAVSKFFASISEQGDDANLFFDDLLTFVEKLIVVMGKLIAIFTSAYDKVSWFVHMAIGLFGALWGTIKWGLSSVKSGFLMFVLYAMDVLGLLLIGASKALGWIPGIGPKLKAAEKQFNIFRRGVNEELGRIKDKTVTIRMRVMGLAAANAAISVGQTLSAMGYAHGGIRGAANGATSSGLTLVGEHGPELAEIKPGGRVWSNPDTQRMLGQGGGSQVQSVKAEWIGSGNTIVDEIMKGIRLHVHNVGGGSVQIAFGR